METLVPLAPSLPMYVQVTVSVLSPLLHVVVVFVHRKRPGYFEGSGMSDVKSASAGLATVPDTA